MVETTRATVVGIGYLPFLMMAAEAAHQGEGGFSGSTVPEGLQVGEVGLVHGNDMVKLPEIIRMDLPGPALKGVAAVSRSPAHARISSVSLMVADRPGRIDPENPGKTGLFDAVPENGLRGG